MVWKVWKYPQICISRAHGVLQQLFIKDTQMCQINKAAITIEKVGKSPHCFT